MINEGWMNHKGGRFTADMSEISHHSKDNGKDVHCPGCKTKLTIADFKERRDDENEVTTWTLKHDCGADLTIFNESAPIMKPTFKQWLLAEGKRHKDTDMVGDDTHPFSVKVLKKGPGKWPTLKGEIYEKDVMIGTFSRMATKDGYIPPIEYKFRSEASKARFDDFADSNSIEETIEALMP